MTETSGTSVISTTTPAPSGASHGFFRSHFAPAFYVLPRDRRHALRIVYGFFRKLDDAVDVERSSPGEYLDAWRVALRDSDSTGLAAWGEEKAAAELLDVVSRFGVPISALEDFIEKGVAVDLERNRFQTPMDTERYCYGVAGTVGIACLPIFGVPVDEAKDFAVRLGIAVQWINTIRDVAVDARMNRIYLPQDHLDEFGCREDDILRLRRTPEFDALIRHEAGVARSHYRRALDLLPIRWERQLRPARIMGRIYIDLLSKIERRGFPVFTKRISLNIVEKAVSTWRALRT
ncbi:MAG: phytoene/squalene synthase family protein [Elusimicrobia bacterium]|nr:phytoene/squalene synthase family protein [Elusimicrobiota bacterium]